MLLRRPVLGAVILIGNEASPALPQRATERVKLLETEGFTGVLKGYLKKSDFR